MNKEFANVVYLAVAVGLFLYARTLTTDPIPAPDATAAPSQTQTPPPVAVVLTPAPAPTPPPAAVQAAPPAAVQAAPAQPAPPPVVAQPQPPAPAPVVAQPATPPPVLLPTAPIKPRPLNDNPDDAPTRTKSGKVRVSTNTALPPAYGPTTAPVHVIIFSDFQCPVCRRAADATHQIAEEFPGDVRIEFWQHALEMHRNAENASVAALAAHRQGKFWQYHDVLFRNQAALDELSLNAHAQTVGLDMDRFKQDYKDPTLRARVKREGGLADAIGARGTPAFLVNGKLSVGWGSWNGFRGQVEREIGRAKPMLAAGTPAAQVREKRAKENLENAEHFQQYLNLALTPLAQAAK